MVTICHNGNELEVASPSLNLKGHLAHGDTIGTCEEIESNSSEGSFSWLDTVIFRDGERSNRS